jgi:hypothetical protein
MDLWGLRRLQIDPARRIAWAETGLTAGEYTAAASDHGLATGFGDTGSVGIGGITLSGGIGFLARKHGLTVDSLWPPTSSPPTASSCGRTPSATGTSSGRFAAAAATSVW